MLYDGNLKSWIVGLVLLSAYGAYGEGEGREEPLTQATEARSARTRGARGFRGPTGAKGGSALRVRSCLASLPVEDYLALVKRMETQPWSEWVRENYMTPAVALASGLGVGGGVPALLRRLKQSREAWQARQLAPPAAVGPQVPQEKGGGKPA
jgi:hypothetical protein